MQPHFYLEPGGLGTTGRCTYRPKVSTLEYKLKPWTEPIATPANLSEQINEWFEGAAVERLFIFAETLTLTFRGRHGPLISLDAYTDADQWTEGVAAPTTTETGRLYLSQPPSDDRLTLNCVPSYEKGSDWVRIVLKEPSAAVTYMMVGTDLVAGVDNGALTDLVLQRLLIL